MRIVIDSNRVIASLLKDSTTRKILFDSAFEFFAPEHIIYEIKKHRDMIIKRAKIDDVSFDFLLSFIFEHIAIIPEKSYSHLIDKSDISDKTDIPYLAVCSFTDANGIWTHDTHFFQQKKVKVFTNIDMLRFMGNN